MAIKIPVAHDFICPWCWVAIEQIRKLRQEFDIEIEWRGYELLPEWMEDLPSESKTEPPNKPPLLSRFRFLLAADGLELPLVPKPPKMRSFNAHQAAEYAKTEGVQDAFIERLYDAFWKEGREINRPRVILQLAEGIIKDLDALANAIETKQFKANIVDFDDDAHANGVYNVPTFYIGEQRLAEQPYSVLRKAIAELAGEEPVTSVYADIRYENPHQNRPYTFINMVTTIDGKIITGERNEPVGDLGTKTDHFLMHRLERKADSILMGANSLRATGGNWDPKTPKRVVVTGSGNVPWDSQFLTKGEPFVLTSGHAKIDDRPGVTIIRAGEEQIDWVDALRQLKEHGIEVLNVLGGSEINAQLLELELIDELFLTLAPKIKLGDDTPTYAGGTPLPRERVQKYTLVSCQPIGNEVFLRYRK
ncbi:MAG: thioredoxin domain-containing protein [Armatimonadetes bacterium]|nr:thioredoxin domain-containing protein [Armatimonadota bacterium]